MNILKVLQQINFNYTRVNDDSLILRVNNTNHKNQKFGSKFVRKKQNNFVVYIMLFFFFLLVCFQG